MPDRAGAAAAAGAMAAVPKTNVIKGGSDRAESEILGVESVANVNDDSINEKIGALAGALATAIFLIFTF